MAQKYQSKTGSTWCRCSLIFKGFIYYYYYLVWTYSSKNHTDPWHFSFIKPLGWEDPRSEGVTWRPECPWLSFSALPSSLQERRCPAKAGHAAWNSLLVWPFLLTFSHRFRRNQLDDCISEETAHGLPDRLPCAVLLHLIILNLLGISARLLRRPLKGWKIAHYSNNVTWLYPDKH